MSVICSQWKMSRFNPGPSQKIYPVGYPIDFAENNPTNTGLDDKFGAFHTW